MCAEELAALAAASARTPWEAFHDPHLAFNVTALRAARECRRVNVELLMASAGAAPDPHLRELVRLLVMATPGAALGNLEP